MAIDFKTFSTIAPYVIAGEQDNKIYPIMLRGRHGIGKSQVVYQTAEKLAWDGKRIVVRDDKSDLPGYRVIERRASQMTEGDLIGLPKTDGDVTSFCPPDWFQFAFMDHFGGLFGSHYTVFRQRLKDKEVDELNQTFNVRSLEYTVDLERHTAIPADLIDVIRVKVSESTEDSE